MKINKEIIQALNPCANRFNNFCEKYPEFNSDIKEFLKLENITYVDKVWVVTRLFSKEQNVKWSLLCASRVLHIFENEYPEDKRPRFALEACQNYLNDSSEENRFAARAAANEADYAADDATDDAATYAAYAAACAAAYAAAYAATYAVNAATYAVNAATNAVRAAAYAAYTADVADRSTEETKNLVLMLECI